jgi:guanine deaminase
MVNATNFFGYRRVFMDMRRQDFFDTQVDFDSFIGMALLEDVLEFKKLAVGDSLDMVGGMKLALILALFSIFPHVNGGPFGSVIIRDNRLVSCGLNRVSITNNPTDHGEINAIRRAVILGHSNALVGATLITSTYPCPMCFAAAHSVGISRILYCNTDEDASKYAGFCDQNFWDNAQFKVTDSALLYDRFTLDGHVLYPDYWGAPLLNSLIDYCSIHGHEPSKLVMECWDQPVALTLFDYSVLQWAKVPVPEHIGIAPYDISNIEFRSVNGYRPLGISILRLFKEYGVLYGQTPLP